MSLGGRVCFFDDFRQKKCDFDHIFLFVIFCSCMTIM